MGKSKDLATGETRFVNTSGDSMTGELLVRRARSNTAGDAALTIHPSDTTVSYGMRIDQNTNSLNFDQVNSGVTRMSIDSAGRVTKPSQPSFHAGISGHDTRGSGYYNHSTGSGWMTVHNTGNHFSSGTFTAPVAGVYQFNVTLAAGYGDVHIQYWNVAFQKNGSGYIGQNWNGWRSGQSTYKSINNQCTISLAANDYIRVVSECNTSLQTLGSASGSNSIFSGYLIG